MNNASAGQTSLEALLQDEISRMYQEVAEHPSQEFHFFHGREAAERFGYNREWLDRAPEGVVASFAGVGNPHERANLRPGETVIDMGSGAGLDAIIAAWAVGPTAKVIGVDMNATMCRKAQAHATEDRSDVGVLHRTDGGPADRRWNGGRGRKPSTQNSAEAYGVKAVMMTALQPLLER